MTDAQPALGTVEAGVRKAKVAGEILYLTLRLRTEGQLMLKQLHQLLNMMLLLHFPLPPPPP